MRWPHPGHEQRHGADVGRPGVGNRRVPRTAERNQSGSTMSTLMGASTTQVTHSTSSSVRRANTGRATL